MRPFGSRASVLALHRIVSHDRDVARYRRVLTYQTCPAEEALVARPYLAPSGVHNWANMGPADIASRIIVPHVLRAGFTN
jgi:hypothetical protein